MTSTPPDKVTRKAQAALKTALHNVRMRLPYLGQLSFDICGIVDNRIKTAGITQDGRLFVNPHWFAPLTTDEALYIAAHEIWHLMLRSHDRASRWDARLVNIAHDWIINDILTDELDMPPPRNGLYLKGASEYSAEQLVRWLKNGKMPEFTLRPTDLTIFQDAFIKAGLVNEDALAHRAFFPLAPSDVLSRADIIRIFGHNIPIRLDTRGNWKVKRGVKQAFSWRGFDLPRQDKTANFSMAPARYYDRLDTSIQAEYSGHIMPFELALQSGLDQTRQPRRSYARASRRQASVDNIILAGRQSDPGSLIIVLDVSASMNFILPKLLGSIKLSAESCGLDYIRIIEVSMVVTHDQTIHISELEDYHIHTENIQKPSRRSSGPHHAPSPWKKAKILRKTKSKPRKGGYYRIWPKYFTARNARIKSTLIQTHDHKPNIKQTHRPILNDKAKPYTNTSPPPPARQIQESQTDLRPAFDYLEAKVTPEHIIVISDMHAYLPNQTPDYDVLWIDTGTTWVETKTPSFGRIIRLARNTFL